MENLTAMEDAVRAEAIRVILPLLCDKYNVSAEQIRARKGALIIPTNFSDGEKCFLKINISVPRGIRMHDEDGNFYYEPYNGSEEVDAYVQHKQKLEARKAANAIKYKRKKEPK